MSRPIFLSALLLQLNTFFGITAMRDRYIRRRQKLWEPLLLVVAAVSVAPLLAAIFLVYQGLYLAFEQVGQGYLVLTLALVAAQVLTLLFGLFYLLSAFFYSRDIPFLMALPLQPWQVLGAKFAPVLVSEYLTIAPLVIPAFLVYGLATGDLGFLVAAIPVYLLLPILPLTVGSLLVLGLVRVSGFFQRREAVRALGLVLVVVIVLGFQFTLGQTLEEDPMALSQQIMEGSVDLLPLVGRYFPPSIWATGWLAGLEAAAGWWHGLLFLAATGAGLLLLGGVAGRIYYPGLLAGTDQANGGAAATSNKKARPRPSNWLEVALARERTPLLALLNREHLLFIRTTMWALNGILGMVIIPVAIVVPLYFGPRGEFAFVLDLLQRGELAPWVTLGGVAMVQFIHAGAALASTAISREGRRFWLSRALPVPPRVQALAKLLHAEAFALVAALYLGAVLFFIAGPGGFHPLLYLLLSLLTAWVVNEAGLAIDLLRPSLDWDDPQKALKGNVNSFLGLLAAFLLLGVMAGVAVLVTWLMPEALFWVLGLFLVALAAAGQQAVARLAESRYPRLG